jgi:adenylosuccinate lyase|tara:strand:- start:397 stop:1743 length:1347 start_codon:yes stop_codon:yes gene_type:complete
MKFEHNNISPLDNRYSSKILDTRLCFSEAELIKQRFIIEIDWLIYLCDKHPKHFLKISNTLKNKLSIFKNQFSDKYVLKIKKIEKKTNHDVKAVEYFIKDYFLKDKQLAKYIHLIHFGLTSEDVNSLAYAIMIKTGIKIHIQKLQSLTKSLNSYSTRWKNISLLSRTHGQAASPSTLGKEIKVFSNRIKTTIKSLKLVTPQAKFSGATGNYHTFLIANDKINWPNNNKKFLKTYDIQHNTHTTQIEPHDWIAETTQIMTRLNNICIDLCQDMWLYISNDIFSLKVYKNEVGSSTMPHKVNPIDFENAEGNFGISNSLNDYFVNKLTKSRLQRDLSDSTVLRNIGLTFGYSQIALTSLINGMEKVKPNLSKINNELDDNWEVLTEAVQTVMRYEGIDNAYEQLKTLSRGKKLNKESYIKFVKGLQISDTSKNKLIKLTPKTYIGLSNKL